MYKSNKKISFPHHDYYRYHYCHRHHYHHQYPELYVVSGDGCEKQHPSVEEEVVTLHQSSLNGIKQEAHMMLFSFSYDPWDNKALPGGQTCDVVV